MRLSHVGFLPFVVLVGPEFAAVKCETTPVSSPRSLVACVIKAEDRELTYEECVDLYKEMRVEQEYYRMKLEQDFDL